MKVDSLNQKGFVVELSGTKEALVQFGIMKMKVRLDDLELLSSKATAAPTVLRHATTVKRSRDENIRSELDLRGTNLEEAIMETDRFIDEAFLGNLVKSPSFMVKERVCCAQEFRNICVSTSM